MPGTVTLFEHKDFGGRSLWLGIDDYAESALHSLKGTDLHDRVSSVQWNLPADVVVVLYEHTNGTGRTYLVPSGRGSDASTHDDDFKDCASSWRWTRRSVASSVEEAFGWIGTHGRAATFDPAGIDLGGGHLQGVGLIDHATLAMSTSGDAAHVLIVEWPDRVGVGTGRVRQPPIMIGAPPLKHAGGLQITDDVLAVGVEDDSAKDRSCIRFLDVANPEKVVALEHLEFGRPGPGQPAKEKRWTAGGVGLARDGAGYLLVVGSWDCNELDFYRSTHSDLRSRNCRFTHVADWSKDAADRSNWIDGNWAAYQSVNLVVDGGRRYVVASHGPSVIGEDWLDLYEIDLAAPRNRRVRKVAKRHMYASGGVHFRWAGGIVRDGGVLHAIATERDLNNPTKINLFDGPGGVGGVPSPPRFLANRRSKETHSLRHPCRYAGRIAPHNRLQTLRRPSGYSWCDLCFPHLADG